ncbi:MAG: Arc family DNA-binding protein [Kluyvera sp.]|uniref:Arc family DNA-binding protein n=1 Tax=Kluyvera sp. TaxID=1538228 RepID=UPI003F40CFEA
MSREDPQLRIRLPIELKEKIESAAKRNSRSMNAEIVQRLDSSFYESMQFEEIIPADKALQVVKAAKGELSKVIFERTFSEINKKIRLGHTLFSIDLTDLELDGLSDNDYPSVFTHTFSKLSSLGYVVPETMRDCDGFMVEIPTTNEAKKPT